MMDSYGIMDRPRADNRVNCRPCTKFTCDEMVCLVPVTVEMVWNKFKLLADTVEEKKNENKIEK